MHRAFSESARRLMLGWLLRERRLAAQRKKIGLPNFPIPTSTATSGTKLRIVPVVAAAAKPSEVIEPVGLRAHVVNVRRRQDDL